MLMLRFIAGSLSVTPVVGSINIGTNGTLLLSGSTNVTGTINFAGGTLRSTLSGMLTNNITFADGTTSTIAAAAGQTLTLAGTPPTPFVLGNGATAKFGSAGGAGGARDQDGARRGTAAARRVLWKSMMAAATWAGAWGYLGTGGQDGIA
jgi:hypothetical protein